MNEEKKIADDTHCVDSRNRRRSIDCYVGIALRQEAGVDFYRECRWMAGSSICDDFAG